MESLESDNSTATEPMSVMSGPMEPWGMMNGMINTQVG